MTAFWCIFGIIAFIALILLGVSFGVFLYVFYFKRRKSINESEYDIPVGDIYDVFSDDMINWVKQARTLPHENFEIKSYDGLTLRGKYYEYKKGAPMEILFHGYKGNSERDMSGGIERCFKLGRNALLVDQRAAGRSEGRVCTFGIKERLDCVKWVEFAVEHFGADVKIGITGISMGASTVLMAAAEKLPENVKFVLADCGFSSGREIIFKVMSEMGLPVKLAYPFVRIGALVFGGFDLEQTSPIEAVTKTKLPIIFVHGDTDAFVPFSMSERMYEACSNEKKRLIKIKGAGHGLAYPVGREGYIKELRAFDNDFEIGCVIETDK